MEPRTLLSITATLETGNPLASNTHSLRITVDAPALKLKHSQAFVEQVCPEELLRSRFDQTMVELTTHLKAHYLASLDALAEGKRLAAQARASR